MVSSAFLFGALASFSTFAVAIDPRLLFSRGSDAALAKKDNLNRLHTRAPEQCQPFSTNFKSPSDVSSGFVGISPANSYETSDWGLHMFMRKPDGVQRNGNVNNVVAEGATLNSTFTLL